jgi:hypothetical protein
MHEQDNHITLTEATKVTPGRPSTNCLWRWCRRGVLSRSGQRVRLEHIRIGGKIFTTSRWVEEFGKALAKADASYFDIQSDQLIEAPLPRRRQTTSTHSRTRHTAHEQANSELKEAGL